MQKREQLIKAIILAAALEEEAVSALIAAEIRKLEYMMAAEGSLWTESNIENLSALREGGSQSHPSLGAEAGHDLQDTGYQQAPAGRGE